MNVKLHTPKSLQSGSGISTMKQLFLSLVATTISIVLTFGTAALIERSKKADEKHEMVMVILNDMSKSITHLEEIDSAASQAFETQLHILHHPETFDVKKYDLMLMQAAYLNPTSSTVENIFSSNIETINTLGNITFTEVVSDFYFLRRQYSDIIDKEYQNMFDGENNILASYDNLRRYDLSEFLSVCESFLMQQKKTLKICQQMMDVSDEELSAFARTRQELRENDDRRQPEANIENMKERRQRFLQAVEASRRQN